MRFRTRVYSSVIEITSLFSVIMEAGHCGTSWIVIPVMKMCYYITIIVTEEIEYEEDFGFIRTSKEISTADYLLLQNNFSVSSFFE